MCNENGDRGSRRGKRKEERKRERGLDGWVVGREELHGEKGKTREEREKKTERGRVEWRSTRLRSSSASIQFSRTVPRILALSRIFAGI